VGAEKEIAQCYISNCDRLEDSREAAGKSTTRKPAGVGLFTWLKQGD
jgi:hypothetical protein